MTGALHQQTQQETPEAQHMLPPTKQLPGHVLAVADVMVPEANKAATGAPPTTTVFLRPPNLLSLKQMPLPVQGIQQVVVRPQASLRRWEALALSLPAKTVGPRSRLFGEETKLDTRSAMLVVSWCFCFSSNIIEVTCQARLLTVSRRIVLQTPWHTATCCNEETRN